MLTVKHGETRPHTLKGIKLSGFAVNVILTANAVNTQCYNNNVDFTNALLKVILKRDGHVIPIIQNDLKSIGLATNQNTFSRRAFYTDFQHGYILTAATVGLAGVTMISFDVDFRMTLDLKGNDELYIEIYSGNGLYSPSVDLNQSFLEIKPIISTGIEKGVPIISTHVIQGGEMRKSFDLGDNVTMVTLLNYDKTNLQSQVIQSLSINSTLYNETLSFRDLICLKNRNRMDTESDYAGSAIDNSLLSEYDQCFEIAFEEEMDKVNLDLTFIPANVTANKNLIVVHSYYTDMKTLAKAQAEEMQKQEVKLSTLKQNI